MIAMRHVMLCLIIGGCLMAAAGCGGSPAQRGGPGAPLTGRWLLDIRSSDIGYVQVVMDLDQEGAFVEGHSREGAASDILGWWDLLLARVFTDYFEHGALLHLREGRVIPGDTMRIEAILHSALGPMRCSATVVNGIMTGVLTRNGALRGDIRGEKREVALPLRKYRTVIDSALGLTSRHIYNRRLMEDGAWESFSEDIRELADRAQDDLDIIFGFYHNAKDLPFSHFYLFRNSTDPATLNDADTNARIMMKSLSATTQYLRISSFAGTAGEIDSVFSGIVESDPAHLIIDLRGNAGGNLSAMRVAAYLADTAIYGGVFLTNRWFEHASAPPAVAEYGRFPLLSEANPGLLRRGMHEHEGIGLKVIPEPKNYKGKVVVLVDGATASSCEPLVYGIRQYRLGTVVGSTTAGAMLSSEEFPVGGDWSVTIPTAEYYTADGFRIDQAGVRPDIFVEPEQDALQYVLTHLIN